MQSQILDLSTAMKAERKHEITSSTFTPTTLLLVSWLMNKWRGNNTDLGFQEWVCPIPCLLLLRVRVRYVTVQLLERLVNHIDSQPQGFLHFGNKLRLPLFPRFLLLLVSFRCFCRVFLADIFIINSLLNTQHNE